MDEAFEFSLGEAVQEKMGDDEIVCDGGLEGAGVLPVGTEARTDCPRGGQGAVAEQVQHGAASVDGIDLHCGVVAQQLGEETAVSVAKDESVVVAEEMGQEVEASALQERTEGEVFKPAIGAGDTVEVGGGGRSHTRFRRETEEGVEG